VDALFKILHVFGAALDLLYGLFGAHVQSLPKHLEEQLGCKKTHVSFVGSDDLLTLYIHATDVVFVAVVKVIHFSDQVVSLIG
jgi:hypothetical protein